MGGLTDERDQTLLAVTANRTPLAPQLPVLLTLTVAALQVVHHWTGPVSVALYAAGDEWPLVQAYVRFLRRCYVPVRDRVTFHAAFPADRMPEAAAQPEQMTEILSLEAHLDCFRPEPSLKELMRQRRPETMRWRTRHGYPQNHLRNLARRTCQTEYVFLVDVDVVPSLGLAQGLNEFLKNAQCGGASAAAPPAVLPRPPRTGAGPRVGQRPGPPQCAFVIPTYELDERVRFPRNKSDLVRLAGKGLARPFHHKVSSRARLSPCGPPGRQSRWAGASCGVARPPGCTPATRRVGRPAGRARPAGRSVLPSRPLRRRLLGPGLTLPRLM
ncbi:hypothetical protein FOCC_FOCC014264 [Frankliniella occidentalis]|nr:hypothetical protein FOCC_FOCC014264 [Frankliniella occidentalis]